MNPTRRSMLLIPCTALLLCCGCAAPARFEQERAGLLARDSRAAIPRGLRRTNEGWEDASLWFVAPEFRQRSIDSWIALQQRREPGWARRGLREISETPPLMIAVIQITAIALIHRMGRRRRCEGEEPSPPPNLIHVVD